MVNTKHTKLCWSVFCYNDRKASSGEFHLTQRDWQTLCEAKVDCQAVADRDSPSRENFPACQKCIDLAKERGLEKVGYGKAWKATGHGPVDAEVEYLWF